MVLDEFYILFKAETQQLRESFDRVAKSTDDIEKRFKNLGTANKKAEQSFSGITKEILGLAVAFNAFSAVAAFSNNLAVSRQQLALTSVRTDELAGDINALDLAFQRFGSRKGAVLADLPKIQQAMYNLTGVQESPINALKVLTNYAQTLYKERGMVGVENYLGNIGVNPDLALGLVQGQQLFEQARKYRDALGDQNSLVAEQYALLRKVTDLQANTQSLYNHNLASTELKMQNDLLDYFNKKLVEAINNKNKFYTAPLAVGSTFLANAFQNPAGLPDQLFKIGASVWGITYAGTKLFGVLGSIYRLLGVIISRSVMGVFGAQLSALVLSAYALGKAFENIEDIFTRIGEQGFTKFFSNTADAAKFVVQHPWDAFKLSYDLHKAKTAAPIKYDLPLLPPTSIGGAASQRNINVNVDGITINSLPGQNPKDIADVVRDHFNKQVGNALAQYVDPVII